MAKTSRDQYRKSRLVYIGARPERQAKRLGDTVSTWKEILMRQRTSIRILTALAALALLTMVKAETAAAASRSVFVPGRALGPLGSAALNLQGLAVPPGFMNG